MNSGPKRRLDIKLAAGERYVSRAALKLAGAAGKFRLDFKGKIVLDVGSSTGGFTDYSLKHGVQKVIAVEAGTGQLHPSLRGESRVELYEKTDIRDFRTTVRPDIVLIDVSFISLRQVMPAVAKLSRQHTQIMAMVKPQFEAGAKDLNKGVIKNDSIRRRIFKDFELWAKNYFIIRDKADSEVAGAKGNQERFYLLSPLK
jgi:23S rRNA (cytidine1920-2'-O)/16S rRNA (cytidine1409-2'-O)-methyltransferase